MKVAPPPYWLQVVLRVLWPGVAVVLTALALPVIALGLLLWPVDRRLRLVRVTFLAIYFIWEDVGAVGQCLWLSARSPRGWSPTWVADHEAIIRDALDNFFRTARHWVGFRVDIDGTLDLGDEDAPVIVLSRHGGPADSLALAWLLTSHGGRVPRIVLAAGLLWDPGIAMVLRRLRAYFVPSRSGAGDDRTKGVTQLARRLAPRDALLIFPEGRNWTVHRQRAEVARLTEAGETERAERAGRWPWLLPHRPRGVQTLLTARPDAGVTVIAHTGLELLDSPLAIWRAIPFDREQGLRVRSWHYPPEEVPRDPDAIETWLDERWTQINDWIAGHHR